MDNWLDLHMHSNYSIDGEFTPEELMEKCAEAGLKVAALADHNTVRGIPHAKEAASRLGLDFFTALEIDCTHEGRNFHLLGYGINETAAIFHDIEQSVHTQAVNSSKKLIELIKQQGFFFDEKLAWAKAVNDVIEAEMIAELILSDKRNDDNKLLLPFRDGGKRSDNPLVNFYWDFCSQGKPAHVPMHFMSLAAAVSAIQENGGAAVLAHPGANMGQNLEITASIIKTGIDGIEAYSSYHDNETRQFYADICLKHGLTATSGSDFHGKTKPSVHLGELVNPTAHDTYKRLTQIIKERHM